MKRSLISWVVVIPKEGWFVCKLYGYALLLVWHRLFSFFFLFLKIYILFLLFYLFIFFNFFWKSRYHRKRRAGAAMRAHPCFGVAPTQAIRDLSSWRHPVTSRSEYLDRIPYQYFSLVSTLAFHGFFKKNCWINVTTMQNIHWICKQHSSANFTGYQNC